MRNLFLIALVIMTSVVLSSCAKEDPPPSVLPTMNPNLGLGSTPGLPIGKSFELPSNIRILGDIRGGLYGKEPINKKYTGPFNLTEKSTYVSLGTGTYVNLYITFFNQANFNTTFTMPGGLIFVDSSDIHLHEGVYQKGYILQDCEVTVPGLDTAFIHLRAYCLNAHLMPSSYAAVYYMGPITGNPELNTIASIMSSKQLPVGHEYEIQSIIWNVTDNGLVLTAQEIAFLNGLP